MGLFRRLFPPALALVSLLTLSGQGAALPAKRVLPLVVDPPAVFDAPLPASRPVSAGWFSDAAFIGDSRTEELLSSGLFSAGLGLTQTGLNVRDLRSGAPFLLGADRATLRQMLEGSGCGKIYLMLGFNEASWMSGEDFYEDCSLLIDDLRSILPQAQIYLQTLLPVTVSRSASRVPDNALLSRQNAVLARLAQNKRVYLVPVGDYFTEANGALSPGLSADGLHLTAQGNALWFQFLRTHTMGT